MSLIKCPECGKEVSNQAKQCMHCGYTLKHHKLTEINLNISKQMKIITCIFGIVCIIAIMITIGIKASTLKINLSKYGKIGEICKEYEDYNSGKLDTNSLVHIVPTENGYSITKSKQSLFLQEGSVIIDCDNDGTITKVSFSHFFDEDEKFEEGAENYYNSLIRKAVIAYGKNYNTKSAGDENTSKIITSDWETGKLDIHITIMEVNREKYDALTPSVTVSVYLHDEDE
jgi:ribosomal protein L37E